MNPARENREHSLAIDGTTTEPSLPAALETHRLYGLSEGRAREIVREVAAAVSGWISVADSVGISRTEQETVGTVLQALPFELAD
jgi:serine/threonine-protein kinase HipA